MEFFRFRRDIPFMRHALVFNVISLVTFLLAVLFLATRGLNFGIDFRGGTVIEVAYNHAVDFNFFGCCQNFQDGTISNGTSPVLRICSSELRATESNGWIRPLSRTGSRPNSAV